MALVSWARWQKSLASAKLNTLLNLRGDIPVFASLHQGKKHKVFSLDEIPVQSVGYYVMDRGYMDLSGLYRLHLAGAFFVTRLEKNTRFYVAESRPVDAAKGLRCDQTTVRNSAAGRADYPERLRRASSVDAETGNALVFVPNQFDLDAEMIVQIYRRRWAIELFFRWIKQHLRLRGFCSISFKGVRVQIWSAICDYLLVTIAKRRLELPHSLWETLQIVSIASMEQIQLPELFKRIKTMNHHVDVPNQLEINYS